MKFFNNEPEAVGEQHGPPSGVYDRRVGLPPRGRVRKLLGDAWLNDSDTKSHHFGKCTAPSWSNLNKYIVSEYTDWQWLRFHDR